MPADESVSRSFVYNSEAPTILINNYTRTTSNSMHNKVNASSSVTNRPVSNVKKSSSITIYNSPADRIQIMINLDRSTMKQEEFDDNSTAILHNDVPPSTMCPLTKIKKEKIDIDEMDVLVNKANDDAYVADDAVDSYAIGDDVLVTNIDGRFYLGTIKTIENGKYLVHFDDGNDYLAMADELSPLEVPAWRRQPFCINSKCTADRTSKVLVCTGCGRGHHKECCADSVYENGQWIIKWCNIDRRLQADAAAAAAASSNQSNDVENGSGCNSLPYDVSVLLKCCL